MLFPVKVDFPPLPDRPPLEQPEISYREQETQLASDSVHVSGSRKRKRSPQPENAQPGLAPETIPRDWLQPLAKTGQNRFSLPRLSTELSELVAYHVFAQSTHEITNLTDYEQLLKFLELVEQLPPGKEAQAHAFLLTRILDTRSPDVWDCVSDRLIRGTPPAFTSNEHAELRTLVSAVENSDSNDAFKGRAYHWLVGYLPPATEDNPRAAQEAHEALCELVGRLHNQSVAADAFRALIEHLPPGKEAAALESVRGHAMKLTGTLSGHEWEVGALDEDFRYEHRGCFPPLNVCEALAQNLPPGNEAKAHAELCTYASKVPYEWCRAAMYDVLAKHLPMGAEKEAHAMVRNYAAKIHDLTLRAEVGLALVEHLPPGAEREMHAELCTFAGNLIHAYPDARGGVPDAFVGEFFAALLDRLPESKAETWATLHGYTNGAIDADMRAYIGSTLLENVPPLQRSDAYENLSRLAREVLQRAHFENASLGAFSVPELFIEKIFSAFPEAQERTYETLRSLFSQFYKVRLRAQLGQILARHLPMGKEYESHSDLRHSARQLVAKLDRASAGNDDPRWSRIHRFIKVLAGKVPHKLSPAQAQETHADLCDLVEIAYRKQGNAYWYVFSLRRLMTCLPPGAEKEAYANVFALVSKTKSFSDKRDLINELAAEIPHGYEDEAYALLSPFVNVIERKDIGAKIQVYITNKKLAEKQAALEKKHVQARASTQAYIDKATSAEERAKFADGCIS